MAEVTCSTCGGDGLSQTPYPTYDASGNPMIEIRIDTCSACNGLGKVQQ
jgi:DnaJ-class molecular chaperone